MGVADRLRERMIAPFTDRKVGPAPNGNGRKMATTGVSFVGAPDWRQVIQLGVGVDPDAEELTRGIALATSAYAYTAIMYRATRVAEPPLFVVEEGDEGDQQVEGHDLSLMLMEPSLDYDMGELQQLTEIYRCVTGSALWIKEDDAASRAARWVPFSGDEFSTFAGDNRIYGRFRVETAAGPKFYPAEEVVHFRDVNPNSWRKGLSKLDVALAQLDLGHQVSRTVRRFMRKAMFPGGVISPDKDWNPSEEEWEAWKASILAWHQGPANAGDPLVLQGGTTFSKAALGLKELLPSEMLDRIEAVVGSVFGIPPVVLGWLVGLKNSPWSQMSEARKMTYEDTIEPRWKDVERKMSRQILEESERLSGRRIAFDLSKVRAFQSDDLTRAEVAATMRDEWTVNERRVYTGLDPLPDGDERGDELGSSTPSPPAATEPTDDDDDDDDDDDPLGDGKILLDEKGLSWTLFDLSTKAAERTWARIIADGLEELEKDVLSIFDRQIQGKQDEIDPDSIVAFLSTLGTFVRDKAEPFFSRLTLPMVISTGETALKAVSSQVGLSFTVLQPALAEYALEEADFLAKNVAGDLGADVARIVQGQLDAGSTVASIRGALQGSKLFSRARAQLIARTETTRAWNGAQRRSMSEWQKSEPEGTVVTKEWLTAGDARVRPAHQALNGKTIPVDEAFDNGLQQPGEPNCRCTLVYSVEEPGKVANFVDRPFSDAETKRGIRKAEAAATDGIDGPFIPLDGVMGSEGGVPFVTDATLTKTNAASITGESVSEIVRAIDSQESVDLGIVKGYLRTGLRGEFDVFDDSGFRSDAPVLRRLDSGKLQIVEGHHRIAAAIFAGRAQVGARILSQ